MSTAVTGVVDGSASRHVPMNGLLRDLAGGMHPLEVAAKHGLTVGELGKRCRLYQWRPEGIFGELALAGQRARMGPQKWQLYCRLWEIAMGRPLVGGDGRMAREKEGESGASCGRSVRPEVALRAILAMLELSEREPPASIGSVEEEEASRGRVVEALRLLAEKESRENAA